MEKFLCERTMKKNRCREPLLLTDREHPCHPLRILFNLGSHAARVPSDGTAGEPDAYLHSRRRLTTSNPRCRHLPTPSAKSFAPSWPTSCAAFSPCSALRGEWVRCWCSLG